MNTKLTLAVVAASLMAAPVAMAQTYGNSYSNDASRNGYERDTDSGLPSTSPAVRSLPNAQPDPWTGGPVNSQSWNAPSGMMSGSSTSGMPMSGSSMSGSSMSGSSATNYGGTYHSDPTNTSRMGGGSTMSGTAGSTGPMTSTGSMGSSASGNRQVLMNADPNIQQRAGRGQRKTELMQTSLLNDFSAAGYVAVRDFHKQGQNYIANAQDHNGNWTTVELDPRTGTISALR